MAQELKQNMAQELFYIIDINDNNVHTSICV